MLSVGGPPQRRGWHGGGDGRVESVPLCQPPAHVALLLFGSSSLTSLEELDRLPLNPATSRVSKMVLKATISALTFLQEHGVAAAGAGGYLSGYGISSGSLVKFIDNQRSSSAVQVT